MGKRQKALNDKIMKINASLGNQQPNAGGGTSDAFGLFTQQLAGIATQFSVNEWASEDQNAYLKNQAQIKFLEQEKRMMLLCAKVSEIQTKQKAAAAAAGGTPVANGSTETSSDECDESDGKEWSVMV